LRPRDKIKQAEVDVSFISTHSRENPLYNFSLEFSKRWKIAWPRYMHTAVKRQTELPSWWRRRSRR